jgi:hypothetical protein
MLVNLATSARVHHIRGVFGGRASALFRRQAAGLVPREDALNPSSLTCRILMVPVVDHKSRHVSFRVIPKSGSTLGTDREARHRHLPFSGQSGAPARRWEEILSFAVHSVWDVFDTMPKKTLPKRQDIVLCLGYK